MPQVIHYDDDLFLIDGMVRVLNEAAKLEPDLDIIGDTLISVAKLCDAALRSIKEKVLASQHRMDRANSLRLLARACQGLADALGAMLKQGSPFVVRYASSQDELFRLVATHKTIVTELRDSIRELASSDTLAEDHVSGDELSELLKNGGSS